VNIIPATQWGRAMRSNAPRLDPTRINEMTVHYTGAKRVDRNQDSIAAYLKATERHHMSRDPKMSGVGYNFAIDKWGRIWELRGWDFKNAANGTTSNNTSFSVNCLVGVEDNEPTPEMVSALQWLYREGVRRFRKPLAVKGHQEHKATACPGGELMKLIRSGRIQAPAPTPAPTPAPPTTPARTYVVQKGDSYWKISSQFLGAGSRWKEIFELNSGISLRPGLRLQIPGEGS
jgi:LysM repeat protein